MYHCGTKPVMMHIANGMDGAIVVTPRTPLPHADREYVLVSSEWCLSSPGLKTPAAFDMTKVDAGPSLDTDFHVVGTLLDRAWVDGDMTHALRNRTASVPAGGGGVFDVKIDVPRLYPFVSHSFASADMGQVEVPNVGHVAGTTSH